MIARESTGTELFAQYALLDNVNVYTAYQIIDIEKDGMNEDSDQKRNIFSLGTTYKIGQMQFGVQYSNFDTKLDMADKKDREDDVMYFDARYNF